VRHVFAIPRRMLCSWKLRLLSAPASRPCPLMPLGLELRLVSCVHGRRGAKEVAQLTAQLCTAADAVRGSMCAHMRREEDAVFPLLQQHLCVAEQRAMVRP
jgi:iron-sulfur cluster repair protein YtfE (RIC family)